MGEVSIILLMPVSRVSPLYLSYAIFGDLFSVKHLILCREEIDEWSFLYYSLPDTRIIGRTTLYFP